MSVGSVDPRAPTELSLPSPRALSQSERASYFGPEAVVDRTPVSALPSVPQDLALLGRPVELTEDRRTSHSEPVSYSGARSVPGVSGSPASSARRSQQADSPALPPPHFARAPRSYSPVSVTPAGPAASARVSQPPSVTDGPRFEIHSELDAVPHEPALDDFDLRRVSTQREPLAGRKPMPSANWSHVHEPVSARRDSALPSERASHQPSNSSAITLLVDRGQHVVRGERDSRPSGLSAAPERAPLPLRWVLGAAAFALILALLVAWVMRAPTAPASDERAQTGPSAASAIPTPPRQALSPAAKAPAVSPSPEAAPLAAVPLASGLSPRAPPAVSALRGGEMPASSAASARALPGPSARANDLRPSAARAPEAAAKPHQSIY